MPDEYQNRLTFSANRQLLRYLDNLVVADVRDETVTEAYAGGSVFQVFLGHDEIVANGDFMRAGTYLIVPRDGDLGNCQTYFKLV